MNLALAHLFGDVGNDLDNTRMPGPGGDGKGPGQQEVARENRRGIVPDPMGGRFSPAQAGAVPPDRRGARWRRAGIRKWLKMSCRNRHCSRRFGPKETMSKGRNRLPPLKRIWPATSRTRSRWGVRLSCKAVSMASRSGWTRAISFSFRSVMLFLLTGRIPWHR